MTDSTMAPGSRRPPKCAKQCDSKRIDYVTLYIPKKLSVSANLPPSSKRGKSKVRRIKAFHFLFLAAYVYQACWIVSTVGDPYRDFLEKAEREGFEVMEGTARMRAELHHALADLDDPDRPKGKVGWFDWMKMDIEEHADRKKREREKNVLDSLPRKMRVPARYSPSFWSLLVTGVVVTLHTLVALLQVWLVGFNCWLNYTPADVAGLELPDDGEYEAWTDAVERGSVRGDIIMRGADGGVGSAPSASYSFELPPGEIRSRGLPTHARITPAKGKDVLVPVSYLPTLGGAMFEYHRRRYVWNGQSEVWTKIRCRTDMPLSFFSTWRGYTNDSKVLAAELRFGPNEFNVRQPTFSELYKAQLLSPFTVFQLFCVILWMLDEYWQYSAFTLFMILTFEATVVFSRIKSLAALKGMGTKARQLQVFQMGRWQTVDSHHLLPGDIFSLTRHKPHRVKQASDEKGAIDGGRGKGPLIDDEGDIVPADLLLLKGFTVVNEASLTGESVPQMKEALAEFADGDLLSMKGKDKSHIMYAGTKLLQCKGATDVDVDNHETESEEIHGKADQGVDVLVPSCVSIPPPHDGGCICFVLRTGFSSAQGKLVRMIEGSQQKVKGHEKETGLLLLLLFCFAVASSGYVLKKGMEDDNRSKYELLLHCILIITSVIPPELPMQMALAVNSSLMTLMKMQIFCTEPYRVPIAGKLDCCLFDKTGTLTTDELVAVGVCQNLRVRAKKSDVTTGSISTPSSGGNDLCPMTQVHNEAGLVLAGCHSLVLVDEETTGDPLEAAALSAMRWRVTSPYGRVSPVPGTEKRGGGKPLKVDGASISWLEILARHHFSSKLQRMSCVAKDNNNRVFALAKGSPEAIGALLADRPSGYDEKSKALSKEGFRVIALAIKRLKGGVGGHEEVNAVASRADCEAGLTFAGFIAFTCRVRKDTKEVLERIKEGGMTVAMVTGDAILTAAHVAKEVGICEPDVDSAAKNELEQLLRKKGLKRRKPLLMLEQCGSAGLVWRSYEDDGVVANYVASELPLLSEQYDLATTGKSLAAAFAFDEATKKVLQHITIFARMAPDAKETVIECLHSVGLSCLMCGDGANDVGALKQADVGVALLSGFGDVNVDKGEDGSDGRKKLGEGTETALITRDEMEKLKQMPVRLIKEKIRSLDVDPDQYPDLVEKEDLVKLYRIKAAEVAVKRHDRKNAIDKAKMTRAELQAKQRAEMAAKQRRMMERVAELESQGVKWAQFKAMKEFMSNEMSDGRKKKAELAKHHSIEGSASAMIAQMEDMETGDLPMVKLGDASIAAPFTSKMPSIRSCVDIIRQGRCTLITSIQMYQILALNCLISAYSLSVLYLDGVKYGDTQMTAMGMLGSISYMSVSRSKPLNRLSSVRPLTSIFHPSLFISLLGQFAVHLITMILAVRKAKDYLPEGLDVDLDGEFKPGIVNSVVFLVSSVQQVTVFVVNLQGRPFMTGLTENRPLLWSLLATFILTFMFASESVPGLNKYFQLVPFPDEAFRDFILKILCADVILAFAFDRLMKFIFCPQILFASVRGTTAKDVLGLARTMGVIFAFMYLVLGNDEQWEEMMREEGRLDGLDAANLTENVTGVVANAAVDVLKTCIGVACEGAADEL